MLAALLALASLAAGELTAQQCPPGYDPVEDCTDKEEHLRDCGQSYEDHMITIGAAYAGCVAACSSKEDSDARSECRAACSATSAAAAAGASAVYLRCKSRAPACVNTCVKDPTHPRWWCPLWPYCPYTGG